ncbi:MAG: acyl-CoA dehydrogenase [Betaproteobacteria bacterium]|nr:acyl-CoA dehydrogenase [Betaproteobacteria bacterium]
MNFELTEEQRMLQDSVRRMMERHATPDYIRRLDRESAYPYELYDAWAEMGLLRLPFAEEHGGVGGSVLDMVVVSEELARKSFDFFTAYGGSVFCGLNVARNGTPAQIERFIPKLLSGEIKMSISMSEPEAGSDVGAMRSTAIRDGDDWILNGQKVWATGAGAEGNVINFYVKTDTKARYQEGISLFLVDKDMPGLALRKLDMLGRRCVGTYEIVLNNVRVPNDRLIGGANNGWKCLLSGLRIERITSTAGHCGAAQAVVDMALAYAKERKQFGKPIGSFQAIAHMLADMQTEVDAARMLMWRAAWMLSAGQDALKEISMAKLFASETYVKVANQGMQIFGGNGYNMEFDMQRHFRDSRSTTIGAGTSQMQRNLIAGLMGLKVQ